ncbi:hypothetical protein GGI12_002390, partial [Dipsacomyces acuminosporus]
EIEAANLEWQDGALASQFTGYEIDPETTTPPTTKANVVEFRGLSNGVGMLVIDPCPFYAAGGGQEADHGLIGVVGEDGSHYQFNVKDSVALSSGQATVLYLDGAADKQHLFAAGSEVSATIDINRRLGNAVHHTATHLLNAALRKIVGTTVMQAGSLVQPDALRFDFTSGALTKDQLQEIEDYVNSVALAGSEVGVSEMTLDQAKAKGALAAFTEKYNPERVRVVEVPGVSTELCGGTHLHSTRAVFPFQIVSEGSIGAGTRRIEAVAGIAGSRWLQKQFKYAKATSATLGASRLESMDKKAQGLVDKNRALQGEADGWLRIAAVNLKAAATHVTKLGKADVPVVIHILPPTEADGQGSARLVAERACHLRESEPYSAHLVIQGKAVALGIDTDTIAGVQAGALLREILARLPGKGGGQGQLANGQLRSAVHSLDQHVFGVNSSPMFRGKAESSITAARFASPELVNPSQWSKVATMAAFPDYQLRVKSPKLCDPDVVQYSGYLDTDEDKHFFFWFFEARHAKREDAPIILWTNGGPGCSSFTGLLMELGPCRASKGGNGTDYNPYGWNDKAHVIFIDQPLNTGFSYGKKVDNSYDAGKDVDVFLRLFYHTFPEYANSKLHVFGESYGGHYVPAIGKAIQASNKELAKKRTSNLLTTAEKEVSLLPLVSVGIGNGLVDVLTQHKYYAKMACDSTYPPVLDQKTCDKMDAAVPYCNTMVEACYRWQNRLACLPAVQYCLSKVMGPYSDGTNNNPYDVRVKCKGDNLCYEIETDIDAYLNNPAIQKELGAEVSKFVSCSDEVHTGFLLNGDWMKPFHREIPPLLEDGIQVLIYAGDADWICNWYGNKAWTLALEWAGKGGFNGAEDLAWNVGSKQAGEVRSFDNFTFLRVFEAGHMTPYDQPENALDMINRWIENKPYA